jgi:hypothetical protein
MFEMYNNCMDCIVKILKELEKFPTYVTIKIIDFHVTLKFDWNLLSVLYASRRECTSFPRILLRHLVLKRRE